MMTFAEALYTLSTERLRLLVQKRKVDPKKLAMTPSKRMLVQTLATDLGRPPSISAAIVQCNARELRLLQMLVASEKQPVKWDTLLEAAGGKSLESAIGDVMTGLENLGLAFRTDEGVVLGSGVTYQVPVSLPERYNLMRCLNVLDALSVRRILGNLGLTSPRDTKVLNMEAIRAHLLDDGPGLRLNHPLDAKEMAVLEYLTTLGGAATVGELSSSIIPESSSDFFRYDWQNRWKQGRELNAIDTLIARGIVHVVSHGYGYNLYLVIPGDLLRVLTGGVETEFWTAPLPTPAPLPQKPPYTSLHTSLVRDVVVFLGALTWQEATRTSTGYMHKSSLKNIARTLSLPEDRYAAFLYALCRAAGLIQPQGEKQIYSLTAKGNSWLHWDSRDQQRALFEAWRSGMAWAEMYNEPLQKANSYRPEESVLAMRQSVLEMLTEGEQSAAFLDLNSVSETLTFRTPLLLATSSAMGNDLVPSPTIFIRQLICECLGWLGAVELGLSQPPGASAPAKEKASLTRNPDLTPKQPVPDAVGYRLTALGCYLLSVPDAPEPEPIPREDTFILQPNAEVFVTPYLATPVHYHLLTIAEPPSKTASGSTLALTRDAIRRALDAGESVRELLSFLQSHSKTGIPQNVEYLINEVSGKHGHIHVGKAQLYIQVDSPLLLKELQARRELKDYFVRTLGDNVAILKADDIEKVLRDLRKAGYLPVSDDDNAPRTFKEKGRAVPAALQGPPDKAPKTAKRGSKLDTALDWNRITQEDGLPWSTATRRAASDPPPLGAAANPALIRILLQQSQQKSVCVEVAYRDPDEEMTTIHILESLYLSGNRLIGYSFQSEEQEVLDFNNIVWARATSQRYGQGR